VEDAWVAEGEPGAAQVLPAAPALRTSRAGPGASLVVVLSRPPDPEEQSVHELIETARLALDLTLSVDEVTLTRAARGVGRPCRLLRGTTSELALETAAGGTPLARTRVPGTARDARLVAALDRTFALAALAAFRGERSDLSVRARVEYRAAGRGVVEVSVEAATLFAVLAPLAAGDGELTGRALSALFPDLVRARIVRVSGGDGEAAALARSLPAYEAFLRAADSVIEPRHPARSLTDPEQAFLLLPLSCASAWTAPADIAATRTRNIELSVRLEELIEDAGIDWDDAVRLVARDPSDPALVSPVPRRERTARSRAGPAVANENVPVTADGDTLLAVPLALTADRSRGPAAHALIASDVVHPAALHAHAQAFVASDILIATAPAPEVQPLPVSDDPAAPLWVDRADPAHRFYAAEFTLRRPQPADDPQTAAFLFRFEQSGVTAGAALKPGLRATVRFTLDAGMSEATKAALTAAGNPAAAAVPRGNLSAMLEVPFRAEGSGEARYQSFAGTCSVDGDALEVEVELLDDWVRLLYGALAYAGFQDLPARLSIAYAFPAYAAGHQIHLQGALTSKISKLDLVTTLRRSRGEPLRPVLETATRTLHFPGGEVRYLEESGAGTRASRPLRPAARPAAAAVMHAVAAAPAVSTMSVAHVEPAAPPQPVDHSAVHAAAILASHPILEVAPGLLQPEPHYVTRTIVHQQLLDLHFDCGAFGNFYVQAKDGGDVAVGCQDALKLGEIVYRQYQELGDLRAEKYRVYRSLQQPGRFLVVPTAYRITRYAASEASDRAYHPVILIYALIAENSEDSRYFFAATVEPDVPDSMRRELRASLESLSPSGVLPALDFPTDPVVQATTTFAWAVPDGIEAPQVTQVWNGFQVSVSTDLLHGVFLKEIVEHSGLSGSVTFTLADGTALQSQVALDTHVVGPWEGGPLEVVHEGQTVTLTNRIAQPVDVGDVFVERSTLTKRLPVAARLGPAETRALDTGVVVEDAWAEANVSEAATLEELEVFEEDVTANVIFINQVNYENNGLSKLVVRLRLPNREHVDEREIRPVETLTFEVTFPLTTYLDAQVVEFQVVKTFSSGSVEDIPWKQWDITALGAVIGLTSQLIS
jgi:hypothetical protein